MKKGARTTLIESQANEGCKQVELPIWSNTREAQGIFLMKSKEALTEALTEQYGRMVHEYGTRSPHIVLRRALCEGMPTAWQKKFIALMEEYDDYYDHENVEFQVVLRGVSDSGKKGVFLKDPYADLDNIPKLPYKK